MKLRTRALLAGITLSVVPLSGVAPAAHAYVPLPGEDGGDGREDGGSNTPINDVGGVLCAASAGAVGCAAAPEPGTPSEDSGESGTPEESGGAPS